MEDFSRLDQRLGNMMMVGWVEYGTDQWEFRIVAVEIRKGS